MKKISGTSFPEQVIFNCVKAVFSDALNRFKIDGVEADIYIPSIKCAIEIDGGFWHDNKLKKDDFKNKFFNDQGIAVIRFREFTLNRLQPFYGNVIWTKLSGDNELSIAIILLFRELSKYVDDYKLKTDLINGNIGLNIENAQFDVLSRFYKDEVHPNVLDYAGGQLWDYEKNGNLNPLNINLENCGSKKFYFKCPETNPKYIRRANCLLPLKRWCTDYDSINLNNKEELLIFEWKKDHCSAVHFCHQKDCQAMKELFKFMVDNYIPVKQGTEFTNKISWHFIHNFKDVIGQINSDKCPLSFLRSVKAIISNRENEIPRGWIKSSNQQHDFDCAIKKIQSTSMFI